MQKHNRTILFLLLAAAIITPLFSGNFRLNEAVKKGDLAEVKRLVATKEEGIDINERDQSGVSPLGNAIIVGHPAIATYLIKSGADLDHQSIKGYTPLHYAVAFQRLDVALLMLKSGARMDASNSEGIAPLHQCALLNRPEMAKLFLAFSDKIDIKNTNNGETPLHVVVGSNSRFFVDLFLEAGANPLELDSRNKTPLQTAQRHRCLQEVIATLQKATEFATDTKFYTNKDSAITTIFFGNNPSSLYQKFAFKILANSCDSKRLDKLYAAFTEKDAWPTFFQQQMPVTKYKQKPGYKEYICLLVRENPFVLLNFIKSDYYHEACIKKICCQKIFTLEKDMLISRTTRTVGNRNAYTQALDELAQRVMGSAMFRRHNDQKFADIVFK